MIDFQNAKSIVIPEGEVLTIARGNEILWQKQTKKYNRELLYIESNGKQYIDTGFIATTTTDYEFVGEITENTKTGWIAGSPTWIGVHKKLGTVAVTQFSSGHKYNEVDIGEVFTIGLFGDKTYFNGVETNTIVRKNATLPLYLFAYSNANGTGTINTSVRMYAFKIWKDGVLVRDFIPVLDVEDIPCLYDKVTDKCYYNIGEGQFTYELPNILPEGCIEVNYLESTGKHIIDTGYPFNSNTDTLELDYACLETAQYKWIFGNYTGKYLGLSTHSYQTLWYGAKGVNLGFTEFNTERHKLVLNANGVFFDGTKLSTFSSFENSTNLYLFAMNYNGTLNTGYVGKARVWGYKHTRNGKIIRDFIPVLDRDNRPCFYDKVSEELFYNHGSADFLYGSK